MVEKTPHVTQTRILAPTDPVPFRTPFGETKIPDPIIDPTITVQPFRRDILGFKLICFDSGATASGPPSAPGDHSHLFGPLHCTWYRLPCCLASSMVEGGKRNLFVTGNDPVKSGEAWSRFVFVGHEVECYRMKGQ